MLRKDKIRLNIQTLNLKTFLRIHRKINLKSRFPLVLLLLYVSELHARTHSRIHTHTQKKLHQKRFYKSKLNFLSASSQTGNGGKEKSDGGGIKETVREKKELVEK